jgi:hypothetical protein
MPRWQIDDQAMGLVLGELIQFVRQVSKVLFVAKFGAFEFSYRLACK